MNDGKSLAAFRWGMGALLLLAVVYVGALIEVAPRIETGVRVIPWQAADLEIQSATPPPLE